MKKICVLGAGSWGTALAVLLAGNSFQVSLWGRPEDGIDMMKSSRENSKYLPGVDIHPDVSPTVDMKEAMEGAEVIVLSVPSQAIRSVTEQAKNYYSAGSYIVNTAKGLEIKSGMRLSQVVEEVLGHEIRPWYSVLSGPSHAEEVGRQIPTAITVAAYRQETAFFIQDVFMGPMFRVYTNPDVKGVELGGALKNIVALSAGITCGLGYGDNTIAALMTRGLAEMTRIGEALGGDPRTFTGLSGMGDLVVTCGSKYSRNRRAGEMIGQGKSLEETLEAVGMVVEGAHATRVVHKLAGELDVEMPITEACYNILYNKKDPRQEVITLMQRQKKHEIEEIVVNLKNW